MPWIDKNGDVKPCKKCKRPDIDNDARGINEGDRWQCPKCRKVWTIYDNGDWIAWR